MSETAQHLDLRPDHWAIVRKILREHVPGRTVLAFGSRAIWTAKEYSDLDLAILGEYPLSLNTFSALAESLIESDLPFKVDLVDWSRGDEAFRDVIRQDGLEVQPSGAELVSTRQMAKSSKRDWLIATIKEVSEKIAMGPFGSSIKVETFVQDGVPIISGKHLHGTRVDDTPGHNFITEAHAQKLCNAIVQQGDIVFTHRGNIGKVAYIPKYSQYARYIMSQSQFCMRCDRSRAIPEFVTYFFKSPEGQHKLLANTSQVGVPSIAQPVSYLRTIEIPLPPLSEQRAIAHILSTLDDKIELNRRMNKTLEAMARALFKDWFVDFGPILTKSEDRKSYLSPEICDLFPKKLGYNGIPFGWENSSIGAEVTVVGGATPSTKVSEFWNGNIYWATPKDLSNSRSPVLLDTARKITNKGLAKICSGILPKGSILLSSRAPIGYLAITNVPVAINQGFIGMIRSGRITNLHALLWTKENMDAILQNANGSTFQEISKRNFRPLKIIVANEAVLVAFNSIIHPLYEQIIKNEIEISTISNLRDYLLPKLISGVICVNDAESYLSKISFKGNKVLEKQAAP